MMAPSPLTRSAIPPGPPFTTGGSGDNGSNHPLFSLDNLYRAYRQCRRRKRGTLNALAFEQDLEANLLALREELSRGAYRPRRFLAFLVTKPKRREIFAADFRDRVVHHVLVGHLEPAWERRFIHDSYACRRGKGTHQAVDRLRTFTRQVTANGTRRAWYLQLDVHGFFISLDRTVLYQRLAAHEDDPAVDWLLRRVLFHDPTAGCQLRNAQRADFDRLPPHKTLFKAAPGCGLPIGNLTSQFFANVYLDALDQFVKHRLKARYYLRYCDDLVLLSADREELVAWKQAIETFLAEPLHLRLNERRQLRPISDGIDWLGYIVRPDYLLVRRRVVVALYQRLAQTEQALLQAGLHLPETGRVVYPWSWSLLESLRQWLSAYLAHVNRAASHHLLERMQQRFPWLAEYVGWQGSQVSFRCPGTPPCPATGPAAGLVPGALAGSCIADPAGWFLGNGPATYTECGSGQCRGPSHGLAATFSATAIAHAPAPIVGQRSASGLDRGNRPLSGCHRRAGIDVPLGIRFPLFITGGDLRECELAMFTRKLSLTERRLSHETQVWFIRAGNQRGAPGGQPGHSRRGCRTHHLAESANPTQRPLHQVANRCHVLRAGQAQALLRQRRRHGDGYPHPSGVAEGCQLFCCAKLANGHG